MNKRSQEQWRALFSEHKASGLKASEFCRQQNICPNYFSKRRKEIEGKRRLKHTYPASYFGVNSAFQGNK